MNCFEYCVANFTCRFHIHHSGIGSSKSERETKWMYKLKLNFAKRIQKDHQQKVHLTLSSFSNWSKSNSKLWTYIIIKELAYRAEVLSHGNATIHAILLHLIRIRQQAQYPQNLFSRLTLLWIVVSCLGTYILFSIT